jgi:glycosyltransferase involved in cell wall biosynthesis
MFSIIIPARLNSKILQNTLQKILEQSFKDFEILVILDLETENLLVNPKIKYFFSGIKSPGEKRNIGISKANGYYLAFLDDDAYPDNLWLENAKSILDSNEEYIGVCGPSITPNESDFLEKISGYIYESFLTSGPTRYRHLPSKHRMVEDYPSVNLIVRSYAVKEIGGFDEKFWPGEDTKFCLDLTVKYGKKIYYSPILKVFHFRRAIYHPHLLQLCRYATHRGFFAKRFPQTSLKFSYFIPSLFLIYLIFLPVFITLFPKISNLFLTPLILYLLILFIDVIQVYLKSHSLAAGILTALGIFFSNISYGIFFIRGLFSKPELVLREVDIVNEKYIKG